jgi:hypothetical protein
MFASVNRPGVLAPLMVALLCSPVQAQRDYNRTELDRELDNLAGKIQDILTRRPPAELRFGPCTCLDNKEDAHGSGLQLALFARLKSRKIAVKDKAAYELTVEYGFVYDNRAALEILRVRAVLRKEGAPRGTPLPLEVALTTKDMRDLTRFSGNSVSLPPDGSAQERNKAFRDGRKKPTVHLGGLLKTRVSSSAGSPYYVELLAGPKNGKRTLRERKASVENGVAFARVDLDEEYQVRIGNLSVHEVACRVFIDGIDMFEFSDDRNPSGGPRFKHIVIPAGQAVVVRGWHKTADPNRKDNYRAFLVTEYGKGASSLLTPKGQVGTIQVSFAHSFDPKDRRIAPRASKMETGFGRPLEGKQEVVQRKIDPPHDLVTIRYSRGVDMKK